MLFIFFLQQLVASSTHLFAKYANQTLHPAVIVFYRGAFAAIAYAAWLGLRRSSIRRIDRSDWMMMLVLGLINIPMNQLMFVWGLRYTTPPDASLAYALSPAFVLLLSRIMFGEALGVQRVVGILVALAGTIIILLEKGLSFSTEHLQGNVIELGASCSWALYTVLGRRMALRYGAVYSTAISMFIGFVLFIPIYLFLPIDHTHPSELQSFQWFSLVYLGWVTSGVGFALWYWLLTKMEAAKVAVFNNLQPVLTTIMSFVLTGVGPTPIFLLGAAVVMGGVFITQRARS